MNIYSMVDTLVDSVNATMDTVATNVNVMKVYQVITIMKGRKQ